jgi:hypothetical protein
MPCYVYGRLYWQTTTADAPGWRLDLHHPPGMVTETLAIPDLLRPLPPPPLPSEEAVAHLIVTALRAYDRQRAEKVCLRARGPLPDYHFIATYLSPSS